MGKEPKRLLCIIGGMNPGGAETFLMKVYRAIDRTKFQMDFYVTSQIEGYYDKEILSYGGRIFYSTPKSKNAIKSFFSILKVVRDNRYYSVLRVSQHSLSSLDLLASKFGGAKILAYRSSNSNTGGNKVNQIIHILFKWLSITIPTIKIAPSREAAEFMFGKNCLKKEKAYLVKNAIPLEKFIFNQNKRKTIRKEFNIEDKFVIGHIGRFSNQKNHIFIIEVFNEIVKKHIDSVLLLVGKGELEAKIKNQVKKLGLEKQVIFLGIRSDISDILMSMDVFIFPSLFEGSPNAVIEAQATGLHCIISDTITHEVDFAKLINYISLNEPVSIWADKVLENRNNYKRRNMNSIFNQNGYNINEVAKEFQNHFFVI